MEPNTSYPKSAGVLLAPDVEIVFGTKNGWKSKIVDRLVETSNPSINPTLKRPDRRNDRIRTVVCFRQNGEWKSVMIRLSEKGAVGFDISTTWEGDVLFLRRDEGGAIRIADEYYTVYFCGAADYKELKQSLQNQNKSHPTVSGGWLNKQTPWELTAFENYFRVTSGEGNDA